MDRNLLTEAVESMQNLLASNFHKMELDFVFESCLDMYRYRFIRNNIVCPRQTEMRGVELSEYGTVLNFAEEGLKFVSKLVNYLNGNKSKMPETLVNCFSSIYLYFMKNFNLPLEKFAEGLEKNCDYLFDNLYENLSSYLFNYLNIFYYVCGKEFYYKGKTIPIFQEGVNRNPKIKTLFYEVINPIKYLEEIEAIEYKNNYQNVEKILLELFKICKKDYIKNLKGYFDIDSIKFNESDIETLLEDEKYYLKPWVENYSSLEKTIPSLLKADKVFLNEAKNKHLKKFIVLFKSFSDNLELFLSYVSERLVEYIKIVFMSFKDVFTLTLKEGNIIIPDFINLNTYKKTLETKKLSIKIDDALLKIKDDVLNEIKGKPLKEEFSQILMSNFNITSSIFIYYKMLAFQAGYYYNESISKKYYGGLTDVKKEFDLAISKINESQSLYCDLQTIKSKKDADLVAERLHKDIKEEGDEETLLDENWSPEELVLGIKKEFKKDSEDYTPKSSFENQVLDKLLNNVMERMNKKLSNFNYLFLYPRKELRVDFTPEIYEKFILPTLINLRFGDMNENHSKVLLDLVYMTLLHINLLGDTHFKAIKGFKDCIYIYNFIEYFKSFSEEDYYLNLIATDYIENFEKYLGKSSANILKEFIIFLKLHNTEFLKTIYEINNVKVSIETSSTIKRLAENLDKIMIKMGKSVSYITSQDVFVNVIEKGTKEIENIKNNYIKVINSIFFNLLVTKL